MKFVLREGYDSSWIDQILDLHNKTELKRSCREKVDRAFQNSFAVVSCWTGEALIGIGRMISDGEMYSSIFDVVVDPDHQMAGVGTSVMRALISKAPDTCIHLTSTMGKEGFYFKLGFRRHKTAMALFPERLASSCYLEESL